MACDEGVALTATVVVGCFLPAFRIEKLDLRIEARRLADDLESNDLAGLTLVVEITATSPHPLGYLVPRLQALADTWRHLFSFLFFTTCKRQEEPQPEESDPGQGNL
jgi:hypothetical protein